MTHAPDYFKWEAETRQIAEPAVALPHVDPTQIIGKIDAGIEGMRESMPDSDAVTIILTESESEYVRNVIDSLARLGTTAKMFLEKGFVPREDPQETDWG